MADTWTVERDEQLQSGLDDGLTFVEIGLRMGLSKNQCIGRATRLGLRPRAGTPLNAAQVAGRRLSEPRATLARLAALDPFPRTGSCVFPHGDPGADGFSFCGGDVGMPGFPYCPTHAKRCYQPRGKASELGARWSDERKAAAAARMRQRAGA